MKYAALLGLLLMAMNGFSQLVDSTIKADSVAMAADTTRGMVSQIVDSVYVSTQPEGVTVVLDDTTRGISPITFAGIGKGEHVLVFKKKGYYQKRVTFKLDSLEKKVIDIVLQQPGFLFIASEPESTIVTINGENKGVTPVTLAQLKPGEYKLLLQKKNYEDCERTVTVTSGKSDTLKYTMTIKASYVDSLLIVQRKAGKEQKIISRIIIGSAFLLFAGFIGIIELMGNK